MSERRCAVLIGSSQFPDEPKLLPLRAPEHDVDGLHDVLKAENLGNFTEISVLKNKSSHEAEIEILSVLNQAGKNDLVVIYYSGHGKLDAAGRLHLAMVNTRLKVLGATSIPVTRIRDFVDNSPSNKVVLILDCCYSGAAGGVFARGALDDQLQLASNGRGLYIMTASTAIQIAQEKENDTYGLFTKKLIEGLETGKADLDEDGNITMDELYRYVHREMLDEGFQEPMKWDLNVRGELVIARSVKSARKEHRKAIRRKLIDLESQDLVPHRVLIETLEFLNRPLVEGSAVDRQRDLLLNQLMEGQLGVGGFIGEWYEIPTSSAERIVSELDVSVERSSNKRHSSIEVPQALLVPVPDVKANPKPATVSQDRAKITSTSLTPLIPQNPLHPWRKTIVGVASIGTAAALIGFLELLLSSLALKAGTPYAKAPVLVWVIAKFCDGMILVTAFHWFEPRIAKRRLIAILFVWPIVLGIGLSIGVNLFPEDGYGIGSYYFDVLQRFTESLGYVVACSVAGALTGLLLGIGGRKQSTFAWLGALSFASVSTLCIAIPEYPEPGIWFPSALHAFVLQGIGTGVLLWFLARQKRLSE